MLKILRQVVNNLYYPLQNLNNWSTLYIDYEKPYVERLWTSMKIGRLQVEYRVYLHKIHPCEPHEALYHPHPWPSAMIVCGGRYETGFGFGPPDGSPPPKIGPVYLNEWSAYQMLSPYEWHYVRPLKSPCLSLMVTGPPFDPDKKKQKLDLRTLTKQEATPIFDFFRNADTRSKILDVLDSMEIA